MVREIKAVQEINFFPPMDGESIEAAFKRSIAASPTYNAKVKKKGKKAKSQAAKKRVAKKKK